MLFKKCIVTYALAAVVMAVAAYAARTPGELLKRDSMSTVRQNPHPARRRPVVQRREFGARISVRKPSGFATLCWRLKGRAPLCPPHSTHLGAATIPPAPEWGVCPKPSRLPIPKSQLATMRLATRLPTACGEPRSGRLAQPPGTLGQKS
jgi:hypothetical protein